MKVLINSYSAKRGGGQTYLRNLLESPPKDDLNLEIEVLAPPSLYFKETENVRRLDLPYEKWLINPISRALWERFILPKLLKTKGYDLLFCPGGLIGCQVPPTCKGVTMFRNMLPFDKKMRSKYPYGLFRLKLLILEKIFSSSYEKAHHVIFISNFAKNYLKNVKRLKIESSSTIHHGINSSFRKKQVNLRELDMIPEEGYFLYVSTIDVYKSQIEVIEAYSILKKKINIQEKLLLVGHEYTPYANKVRKLINELKLENDVILTGPIKHEYLPTLYAKTKLNIFASQCENCPNILLESMASGAPTIVSNSEPNPEFIKDLEIYFDPTSPADIAQKMEEVFSDNLYRNNISKKLLELSESYSWENTASKTWETIAKAK